MTTGAGPETGPRPSPGAIPDRAAAAEARRAPRRVLISGGTSGIGYACAEHLAGLGDPVWVLGSNPQGVEHARAKGCFAGAMVCDVSREGEVEEAIGAARRSMGGIDGVFVNAGIDGEGRPAGDSTSATSAGCST